MPSRNSNVSELTISSIKMKRFVKKLARPGIEPQKEQENGELSVPSTGGVASASTPPNFVDGAIDKGLITAGTAIGLMG